MRLKKVHDPVVRVEVQPGVWRDLKPHGTLEKLAECKTIAGGRKVLSVMIGVPVSTAKYFVIIRQLEALSERLSKAWKSLEINAELMLRYPQFTEEDIAKMPNLKKLAYLSHGRAWECRKRLDWISDLASVMGGKKEASAAHKAELASIAFAHDERQLGLYLEAISRRS